MSLVDRTNETIPLSMPHQGVNTLSVDIDQDSSIWPEPWVWLMFDGGDEFWSRVTLEEAGKLHDRLGRILDRVSIDRADLHIPHGPVDVTVNEADAQYLRSAADRWRTRKIMGFNLTATVAGILETLADKIEGVTE